MLMHTDMRQPHFPIRGKCSRFEAADLVYEQAKGIDKMLLLAFHGSVFEDVDGVCRQQFSIR